MTDLKGYQAAAIHSRYEHMAFFAGVAAGKTFAGAHFYLNFLESRPDLTFLIGANNHDQLSQATMRELIYWLDEYGYEYEIDSKPFGVKKAFKTYKNILSVRSKKTPKVWSHAFTRIMSAPNPLRGIEFAGYWLDETRDTPENTHDVVLSRLRESRTFRRGLITSTTNGEDWAFKRFVQLARPGQHMYGSMHIPTSLAVTKGIISQAYYDMLRSTYSPMLAMQELDALHVNVRGGRAYYSFGDYNRRAIAPWGDSVPSRERPLIIGADFNYAPSPCVWMVGQLGPDIYTPTGRSMWSDHIHWFGEIVGTEISTPQMTRKLLGQYPDFFYRIFGDSSGTRGTTSNAGVHDYAQIREEMDANDAACMIDAEQSNPHVKDRIENMNRLAYNAMGETFMTYSPTGCPMFDADVKMVGWKPTLHMGRAKLDDGGDKQKTHASDGGGYAAWKVLPPRRTAYLGAGIASPIVTDMRDSI